MNVRTLTSASVTMLSLLVAPVVEAQVGGLAKRAGRSATDELNRKIDTLVRTGVRCAVGDRACVEKARKSGRTPVMTDAAGNILTDADGVPITDPEVAAKHPGAGGQGAKPAGLVEKPGTGAWANYDFVPGERVLVAEDFSRDTVGDFPRRFTLAAGTWEVVEWQNGRYLRATTGGAVGIPLPETLPDRFTVEFTASVQHGNAFLRLTTGPLTHGRREYAGSVPSLEFGRAGLRVARGEGPPALTTLPGGRDARTALMTVRIMADGTHMKMYVNEQRVVNAPNAVFPRTDVLFLSVGSASQAAPILVGPLRIAAGGRDLYDALEKDGRVATQGIYFATDSAVIRPESTATLKEIGTMLQKRPELRLLIEGHTDSDGDEAYNLELSARRAQSVKAYLVEAFGIDAGRLETAGLGETRPVADNAAPEGKQQNRRVELVKQGG